MKAENKELSNKLAAANVEKYEATINELTEAAQITAEELDQIKAALEDSTGKLDASAVEIQAKAEALEQAEARLAEIEHAENQRLRKDSLVSAGLSEEDAVSKMELFGELSDDQFEALAKTLGEYAVVEAEEAEETEAADTEDDDDSCDADASIEEEEAEEAVAAEVDEEVLETAEADETVDISVESDEFAGEDVIDSVRAGLHDWVNKVILKNESGEK